MPNLWDNRPDAPPQAELNPLTNPLLEQNLGRWAKVYFGNPPGKREQAVSRLLEQIRSETGGSVIAERPSLEDFLQPPPARETVCPNCGRNNPPLHKFCGRCGAVLNAGTVESNGIPASRPAEAPLARQEGDVPWLRDRILASMTESSAPAEQRWKYLAGGLAIALAVFAYVQWAPKPVRVPSPGTTGSRQTGISATASPIENPPPTSATPQANEVSRRPEEPVAREVPSGARMARPGAVPGIEVASQKSPLPGASPSGQSVEGGAADLRLAQRFLGGEMGRRDSSEAAQLLWKAVRKQNSTAAVLLSDLYVRGDGVPRSCDQARLLLLAAAKRGAPQAIQQLRGLQAQGCP